MKKISLASIFCLLFLFSAQLSYSQRDTVSMEQLLDMSFEELMNQKIVSVSKVGEKLSQAPANIITVTKQQIENSGYTSLSEVFRNLPGFDVNQSYGGDYITNYMRGFRSYTGSYYLVLVDGISQDNLWFQDAKALATIPLSNVERVEIVYGPSSAMYGVNALMGVVNVITKKLPKEDGVSVNGRLTTGFNTFNLADVSFAAKKKDIGISITARFENFDVGEIADNNSYEWTKDKYLLDKSLWGNMVEHPSFGGDFTSLTQNRAVDARLTYKQTEFGFQLYKLDAGKGFLSATDRVRPQSRFGRQELSVFTKHSQELIADKLSTNIMLRYRKSDVPSDSPFPYARNNPAFASGRSLGVNLYQSLNSSWTISQDFFYKVFDKLNIVTGFQYEHKNLQRDYNSASGPSVDINAFDINSYAYPTLMPNVYNYENMVFQSETGVFLQANYEFLPNHRIVLGTRYNNNSQFGEVFANRGALVSQFGKVTVKLLYGEGIQSPPPRLLYGQWEFQGQNQTLKPIKAQTTELDLSFLSNGLSAKLNAYRVTSSNTILQTYEGAENVGEKEIFGIDLFLKTYIEDLGFLHKIDFWANYGYTLAEGEEKPMVNTVGQIYDFESGTLGDIAPHKFQVGADVYFTKDLILHLQGRYVSEINTIFSNPIGAIDPYFVLNTNLTFKNILNSGIGLSVKAENLLDQTYFHPGVGSAGAGNTPGKWNGTVWEGSKDFYSSLLPQSGRMFLFSVLIDI